MQRIDSEPRATIGHQMALLSILAFWLFYGVVVTVRAAVMNFPEQGEMAVRRAGVTLVGIFITWLVYLGLRLVERQQLSVRIGTAFVLAIPAAIAIACVNYYAFTIYDPISLFEDAGSAASVLPIQEIAEVAVSRYFFIVAWALLYLALSYARGVRDAERRISRFAQAAQQAELRSLRYQVNPHFLFNTLNSLSSLVMSNRNDAAEAMIQNLSDFYRTSLSGDPLEDVILSEEVELQRRYLAIEQVRFPERLRVEIDIPDALMDCCVPGLILQPLVENAIKYGVSRSTTPVTITIGARCLEEDMLTITIADDADPATQIRGGKALSSGGIGLANVRDRLEARFGALGSLKAAPRDGGGFLATIRMPKVHNDC